MVIRYEWKCPECNFEFSTNEIKPECPICGYTQDYVEDYDGNEEVNSEIERTKESSEVRRS